MSNKKFTPLLALGFTIVGVVLALLLARVQTNADRLSSEQAKRAQIQTALVNQENASKRLSEQVKSLGATPVVKVPQNLPTSVTGPTGAQGVVGPTGATGPAGAQGVPGPAGPSGPPGPTGDTGAAGSTGASGTDGTDGKAGTPGEIGPQGDPGPPGPQGVQGDPGPAGPAPTGTYSCPDGQYMTGITFNADGTATPACATPALIGPAP